MLAKQIQDVLNNEMNFSMTENGALGFRTSGKALLDINFAVASLRSQHDAKIASAFAKAYCDDKLLAIKWLFYARDIRGGLGERRIFRIAMKWLIENDVAVAQSVIPLIAEYGRWDDMITLLNVGCKETQAQILAIVKNQFSADLTNLASGSTISLLAKWMPSINTSSNETVKMARFLAKSLGLTEKQYRKGLSALRAKIDIVESAMSANKWGKINYGAVPSRANLVYNSAFLKHDEGRRRKFLEKVKSGDAKINSGTLFPHDIVARYGVGGFSRSANRVDDGLEALWNALPNYVNGDSKTIVVADGSGSMFSTVGKTSVKALDVANALAIYFAERCTGEFHNKYITFSNSPQLVNLGNGTLLDKLRIALTHSEVASTNLESVFNLILNTAIKNSLGQDDMPANILIISDMEFNSPSAISGRPNARLFEVIAQKYASAGYKLPRLVFWNVNSRTGTIPVTENELGVALVSGFSPSVAKMVLSNQTDPYLCLLEAINAKRYDAVQAAFQNGVGA